MAWQPTALRDLCYLRQICRSKRRCIDVISELHVAWSVLWSEIQSLNALVSHYLSLSLTLSLPLKVSLLYFSDCWFCTVVYFELHCGKGGWVVRYNIRSSIYLYSHQFRLTWWPCRWYYILYCFYNLVAMP